MSKHYKQSRRNQGPGNKDSSSNLIRLDHLGDTRCSLLRSNWVEVGAAGRRKESRRPHASRALTKGLQLALLSPQITFLAVTIGRSNWQHIFYYFLRNFFVSTGFFPILINRKPRIVSVIIQLHAVFDS